MVSAVSTCFVPQNVLSGRLRPLDDANVPSCLLFDTSGLVQALNTYIFIVLADPDLGIVYRVKSVTETRPGLWRLDLAGNLSGSTKLDGLELWGYRIIARALPAPDNIGMEYLIDKTLSDRSHSEATSGYPRKAFHNHPNLQ